MIVNEEKKAVSYLFELKLIAVPVPVLLTDPLTIPVPAPVWSEVRGLVFL